MATKNDSEKIFYNFAAKYYDLSYTSESFIKRHNDLPFYTALAKRIGGSVLEVGCGTGRILIPTARDGSQIDGLDFSKNQLELLRIKLSKESETVQSRVKLFEADMRNFSLAGRYDLITVPFRGLQHLFTLQEQQSAFNCFNKHLKSNGKLAFNVFHPNHQMLDEIDVERNELEWKDPNDSSVIFKRSSRRLWHDKINQTFESEFIFRSYRDEKLINEVCSRMKLNYYTYLQLQLLLMTTGFEIVEQYGSFEMQPITTCNEMIIVAKKT